MKMDTRLSQISSANAGVLLQGWGLQVAPEELTHAATWTALAAA